MPKFWKSREFKNLQKEWEEKLKTSGLEDAEKEVGGERVLRQSADYAFRRKETTEIVRDAKQEYFSLLSEWLHKEKNFEGEIKAQPVLTGLPCEKVSSDRLIMERTAEGKSIQEISRELKALGMEKHNRDTIRYVRRRYENKWGIKCWKREDTVSRRVATPSSSTRQLKFRFST